MSMSSAEPLLESPTIDQESAIRLARQKLWGQMGWIDANPRVGCKMQPL